MCTLESNSRLHTQLVAVNAKVSSFGVDVCSSKSRQELNYRQQIARQLRTRYAEGIYRHKYYTVTLQSRLSFTQGHWKRNHWIDHARRSSSRVIWRWILLWPWNVGQRSLKVIENGNIWKIGYGFLFAFYSNHGRICSRLSRLWDIQCQRMAWPWKPDYGSFTVIENGAVRQTICDFLLGGHCKHSSILYHFQVVWRWIISWLWNRG